MKVDLLLAGSPCQGFSRSGKGLNFDDDRSKLFFEFVKAIQDLKPKYWLLENVDMKKEWQDTITEILGVEPIKINSMLLSGQKRPRTYWTNIPGVTQPEDKHIKLLDIAEEVVDSKYYILREDEGKLLSYVEEELRVRQATKRGYAVADYGDSINLSNPNSKTRRGRVGKEKCNTLDTQCNYEFYIKNGYINNIDELNQIGYIDKNSQATRIYSMNGKSVCLKGEGGGWGAKMGLYAVEEGIRKLTPLECERLQTVPDNYTDCVSDSQRYRMLGNGWTIEVISHILSFIPEAELEDVVSLFDGLSGGRLSLDRAEKKYKRYYASEIDKYAIQVSKNNYEDTIHMGDVTKIDWNKYI